MKNYDQKKTVLGYTRGYKKASENRKLEEAKPEYHKKECVDPSRYANVTVLVLAAMIVFVVVVLVYAVYTVIHVSKISNLSGVHVTQGLKGAVSEIFSKNKHKPAYKGWLVFQEKDFQFSYPPDWKPQESEEKIILRKFGKESDNFEFLAAAIVFSEIENPENLPIREKLEEQSIEINDKFRDSAQNGRKFLRTGELTSPEGLQGEAAFWGLSGKILSVRATYYHQDTSSADKSVFEKIVSSVSFYDSL
jgi:hypothetical protein